MVLLLTLSWGKMWLSSSKRFYVYQGAFLWIQFIVLDERPLGPVQARCIFFGVLSLIRRVKTFYLSFDMRLDYFMNLSDVCLYRSFRFRFGLVQGHKTKKTDQVRGFGSFGFPVFTTNLPYNVFVQLLQKGLNEKFEFKVRKVSFAAGVCRFFSWIICTESKINLCS